MSDRTTKKVIIGILVMLIGIPLLQADEVVDRNEFSMNMVLENRLLLANEFDDAALENWEFSESLIISIMHQKELNIVHRFGGRITHASRTS
jgi:hypothetical protein